LLDGKRGSAIEKDIGKLLGIVDVNIFQDMPLLVIIALE
jgi:hypothetical protein